MKSIYLVSLFFVTLWCGQVAAATEKYSSAQAFIRSIPDTRADASTIAQGDLNGDGLDDLVIALSTEAVKYEINEQLHVLTQDSAGLFTLEVSSEKVERTGMGCCWLDSIEIKKGSFYVQSNAKSACVMSVATHQFKLYKGSWRLIGLKKFNYHHCDDPQLSEVRDINILTGKIIDSQQFDAQPAKYENKQFKPQIFLLKDYNFRHGFGAPEI